MAIDYEAEILKRDQQIAELLQRNQEMKEEIKNLKELLKQKGARKGSKKPKFKLNYSVEGIKSKCQRGKQATGRRRQSEKVEQISLSEAVYPENVEAQVCVLHREQSVWRIIEGKAEYVCYCVYVNPENETEPVIAGVRNSRSEYGLEVMLIVAFLHYWIGLSLDHVCDVLQFFTGLELTKSQANGLLNQLSADWAEEYDTIAEIIALQLVIYIDETGWKVGKKGCYTWAFSTLMYVLFRCGVGRGKAEAQSILGDCFPGIGVSDDYAAYKNLFSKHQLCWAHLLRKAIKLMLEHPERKDYSQFFEDLYQIYQDAVRAQKDRRLSRGRSQKAEQLKTKIKTLCTRAGETINAEQMSAHEVSFIRLQNELVKGIKALFVFVEHPEVEATNNRSERNVRREAEVRKGGRTSKTQAGAKRRSILMTVLATLNTRVPKFTLANLIEQVSRWAKEGYSIFKAELHEMKAHPPPALE